MAWVLAKALGHGQIVGDSLWPWVNHEQTLGAQESFTKPWNKHKTAVDGLENFANSVRPPMQLKQLLGELMEAWATLKHPTKKH